MAASIGGGGVEGNEGRCSFFEKKNQKNFCAWGLGAWEAD